MSIKANQMDNERLILKAMERNIKEKICYIPRSHTNMKTTKTNSTVIVDSGLPSDTFNTAFGVLIDKESAEKVYSYYKNKRYPCSCWVGKSSDSKEVCTNMEKAGFQHDEYNVGMVGNLTKLQELENPTKELCIKQCKSEQDFNDFGDVLASIFHPYTEEQ